jgi:hypothetical protein
MANFKKIKMKSPDPFLGKIVADNTVARIAHINQLIDQLNATSTATYKVYSALVAYTAGGLTVPTVFENTLGASITWGSSGTFGVAAAGTASSPVFTNFKTVVIATPYSQSIGNDIYVTIGTRVSSTVIDLRSISTENGGLSTPFGITFFLEIRVYP